MSTSNTQEPTSPTILQVPPPTPARGNGEDTVTTESPLEYHPEAALVESTTTSTTNDPKPTITKPRTQIRQGSLKDFVNTKVIPNLNKSTIITDENKVVVEEPQVQEDKDSEGGGLN